MRVLRPYHRTPRMHSSSSWMIPFLTVSRIQASARLAGEMLYVDRYGVLERDPAIGLLDVTPASHL
jgi:hypothetical protein